MTMRVVFALLLIFSMVSGWAQVEVEDGADWKDRVFTGGGGSLGGGTDRYGNKYFSFALTPMVGYMLTPKVSAGTSLTYQSINYSDVGVKYVQYGAMPFVRYNMDELFLTAEYNYLNIPVLNAQYETTDRLFASRLLVGAGYSVPIGGRARLNMVGMYDLLYKPNQYFLSPWVFRVFFSI